MSALLDVAAVAVAYADPVLCHPRVRTRLQTLSLIEHSVARVNAHAQSISGAVDHRFVSVFAERSAVRTRQRLTEIPTRAVSHAQVLDVPVLVLLAVVYVRAVLRIRLGAVSRRSNESVVGAHIDAREILQNELPGLADDARTVWRGWQGIALLCVLVLIILFVVQEILSVCLGVLSRILSAHLIFIGPIIR